MKALREALSRIPATLATQVDGASLAVFRMFFGALLVWEVVRYFQYGWIEEYYVAPQLHFKYLFFEWVNPWPGTGMYWHFALLGVLAACIALGLFYRAAMALFIPAFGYIFLLDQARYLNHFYLVLLIACLLLRADAHHVWSLDRALGRVRGPQTAPVWNVWVLRAQMFLVYFFGGIAKLNGDWLRGMPIRDWMAERASVPVLGPIFVQEWAVWVAAWGGAAFDLGIGFLLLGRRTRTLALVLALGFHGINNFLFTIGIFPFFAMALTLLFLPPDWPRRLGRRARRRAAEDEREADPCEPGLPARAGWTAALLGGYLALQLLMPLRHWVYPGDVAWTEEGHRFSWRMKLREKACRLAVTVYDPATEREWPIDANDHLRPWQFGEMAGRPDMLVQYAHWVRDRWRARGVAAPEVYVSSLCSLNGAPERELVDPNANLAAATRSLAPSSWIVR